MLRPVRIAADPAARGAPISRRDLGRGTVAVALSALLGSATLQSSPAAAQPVPAAPGDPGEPALRLDALTPAAVLPASLVRVAATVTAPAQAGFPGGELRVAVNPSRLSTRGEVEAWETRDPARDLGTVVGSAAVGPLPAGGAAEVLVTFAAADLGLEGRPWGPRGVSLSLHRSDPAAPGPDGAAGDEGSGSAGPADGTGPATGPPVLAEPSAVLRTFLVHGPESAPATPLAWSVLLPLAAVDPAAPDPELTAATLYRSATDGRLAAQGAIAARPEIDWLLDPALLDLRTPPAGSEEAPLRGDGTAGTAPPEPAPGPTRTGAPGQEGPDPRTEEALRGPLAPLARDLLAAAGGRSVWTLPYGRVHLPSLDATPHLADDAAAESERILSAAGLTPAGRSLLPLPASLSGALPDELADHADVVLLPEASMPVVSGQWTPQGAAPLPTEGDGDVVALLPDLVLTRALVRASAPDSAGAGRQRLLAETAMIQLEAPNAARQVLLGPNPDWAPDTASATAALDALSAAGWLRAARTEALVGAADGSPRGELRPVAETEPYRLEPLEAPREPPRLPDKQLATLESHAGRLTDLAVAVEDDTALRSARQSLLLAASTPYVTHPGLFATATAAAVDVTAPLLNAVRFPDSSQVNLVAGNGAVPLTIVNDLPVRVTVVPLLDPEHPIVRFGTEDSGGTPSFDPVTVAPESSLSVDVPVEAVTNGTVEVTMRLLNEEGDPVSEPVQLSMTVNADWEDAATGIFGGAMGALLVFGVIRARRRKRQDGVPTRAPAEVGPPPDEEPADDPEAGRATEAREDEEAGADDEADRRRGPERGGERG